MSNRTDSTRRLVGMSIFTAMVVVLQLFATFVKFGPFSITLALAPIVVGAALYGPKAGAWLGAAFGAVVLIMCIVGVDIGGAILWNVNPAVTGMLCIVKGAAAGWVSGLVYRALSGKNTTLRVVCAAICSPIVNTGIFCLSMVLFFHDTLVQWAGGSDLFYYIFIGLVGVNFLVELLVNTVLAPVIARIIKIGQKETAT
ncbi:MAG TPA: ECF transporter S component [Candidatus Acidoferrum sp.]|nr:ECF transporter S component [Candidatus Acidoferrum sp.]